jgi:MATE family multidrug resistance protein
MLMSLVFSALAFFAICFTLVPFFGNHALWLALVVYVIVRGLVLTVAAHKKIKKA